MIDYEWWAIWLNVIFAGIIPHNFIEHILTPYMFYVPLCEPCAYYSHVETEEWLLLLLFIEDGVDGYFDYLFYFYVLQDLKSAINLFLNNYYDIVTLGLGLFFYVL